eukprot:1906243-Amphidinium_carterae.1
MHLVGSCPQNQKGHSARGVYGKGHAAERMTVLQSNSQTQGAAGSDGANRPTCAYSGTWAHNDVFTCRCLPTASRSLLFSVVSIEISKGLLSHVTVHLRWFERRLFMTR